MHLESRTAIYVRAPSILDALSSACLPSVASSARRDANILGSGPRSACPGGAAANAFSGGRPRSRAAVAYLPGCPGLGHVVDGCHAARAAHWTSQRLVAAARWHVRHAGSGSCPPDLPRESAVTDSDIARVRDRALLGAAGSHSCPLLPHWRLRGRTDLADCHPLLVGLATPGARHAPLHASLPPLRTRFAPATPRCEPADPTELASQPTVCG
mmetsp:Transcript_39824/g.105195  ORF Transcript_39824/g.105195 Transcript_39824/m.105195 type:complete len:213 (+) Transcript_39824:1946-2584(+)